MPRFATALRETYRYLIGSGMFFGVGVVTLFFDLSSGPLILFALFLWLVSLVFLLFGFRHAINATTEQHEKLLSQNIDLQTARHQLEYMLAQERDHEKQLGEKIKQLQVAERKTQEEQVRLQALLGSIGEGVVATDGEGRITYINQAAERMIHWTSEEKVGKLLPEISLLTDEKGDHVGFDRHPMYLALHTRKPHSSREFLFALRDGARLAVAISATPIIVDDQLIGAIEVFRDITRERAVDKAKTEFVSLASHQLRTPLSAINWYVEMLLAGDAGALTPEQRQYLEEIYRGNQRMVGLVSSLLNVSRIDLGTFSVEPEMASLKDVAESVLADLKPQILARQIVLVTQYDPEIPTMPLDVKLMQIVFQNLLSNAIKYSLEKGRVELHVQKNDQGVLISIVDHGLGIPAEQQAKIFTKLFRADNAKEKVADGNGLGLYIVKAIIEQAEGKVWFTSEENKGTTFYCLLPITGMRKKDGSRPLSV